MCEIIFQNYSIMDTEHSIEKSEGGMCKSSIAHFYSRSSELKLLFSKDTTWLISKQNAIHINTLDSHQTNIKLSTGPRLSLKCQQ